jgi:tetratricopeptide (TPR) repeat protein
LELTEADHDPDPQRHRFDLRFVHVRLGDVALARLELEGADHAYRQALEYAEEQRAAAPDDPKAQREVPICYLRLGGVALRRADPKGALEWYRKYQSGCQALAAANPNNNEAARDLASSNSVVGDALAASGDFAAASESYKQALTICQRLMDADPRSLQKLTDAGLNVQKLADAAARSGRFDEAVAWLEKGQAGLGKARADGVLTGQPLANAEAFYATYLAVYRGAPRALAEPEWIATQPALRARYLWGARALALARRGEISAAAQAASTLHDLAPHDAESLGLVARAYALCVRATPEKDQAARREYAARAFKALGEIVRTRPNPLLGGLYEPDLDPLQEYPEYWRLLGRR